MSSRPMMRSQTGQVRGGFGTGWDQRRVAVFNWKHRTGAEHRLSARRCSERVRRPRPLITCAARSLRASTPAHGAWHADLSDVRPLSSPRNWTPSATTVSIYMESGERERTASGCSRRWVRLQSKADAACRKKSFKRLWRGQQILKGSELHVPQPVSLRGSTVAQASFRDVIPVSRRDHSAGRTRISTRRFF